MSVMKKIAIGVAAITTLIATHVMAADIVTKAPPPAPAPVYNWTGWYVGMNLGASFGNVKTDFNAAPVTLVINAIPFSSPGFTGSNTEYPSGFIGGGQIGYNWQLSPIWVVGLEADIQGAREKDTNNLSNSFSFPAGGFTVTGAALTNYTTQIDWFGTVRGRLGYVCDRRAGLRQGRFRGNEHGQRDSGPRSVLYYPCHRSFSRQHRLDGGLWYGGTDGNSRFDL
jgi:outer membrane immunogenic protein